METSKLFLMFFSQKLKAKKIKAPWQATLILPEFKHSHILTIVCSATYISSLSLSHFHLPLKVVYTRFNQHVCSVIYNCRVSLTIIILGRRRYLVRKIMRIRDRKSSTCIILKKKIPFSRVYFFTLFVSVVVVLDYEQSVERYFFIEIVFLTFPFRIHFSYIFHFDKLAFFCDIY